MLLVRNCRAALFIAMVSFSVSAVVNAQGIKKPDLVYGKWQYKFQASNKVIGTKPLPKNSLVTSLGKFAITGSQATDTNRLNRVVCDGQWGTKQGVLSQISGRAAAVKLGRAKDFELEMGIEAEGTGGWFLLFGYDQGHGYGVYNVQLRSSGSPWYVSEFRDNKGIEDTDQELVRYQCRGKQSLKLRVANGKASMTIGNQKILDDVEFTSLHAGDIILGTYDTQYGPKKVKVFGVRLRTIK